MDRHVNTICGESKEIRRAFVKMIKTSLDSTKFMCVHLTPQTRGRNTLLQYFTGNLPNMH